jgi:hypothetical protein
MYGRARESRSLMFLASRSPRLFLEFALVTGVALKYEAFQTILGALHFYPRPSETLDVLP